MEVLDEDQTHALKIALEGHSFLLTGNAGTGKTHCLKAVVSALRKSGKSVLVTATTGMGCNPLRHERAQTVHSTFGLRDGRYNAFTHKQYSL